MTSEDRKVTYLSMTYLRLHDNWVVYGVRFDEMSEAEMKQMMRVDSRDLPYFFELDNGVLCHVASVLMGGYSEMHKELSIKAYGFCSTSPEGLVWSIRRLFGYRTPKVPQERAPIGWHQPSWSEIESLFSSGDVGQIHEAITKASCQPFPRKIELITRRLLELTRSPSKGIRSAAFDGLAEIARLHGVTVSGAVDAAEAAVQDPETTRAATHALEAIERFVNREEK